LAEARRRERRECWFESSRDYHSSSEEPASSEVDQSRTRVMLALRKLDVDGSLVTELLKK
jgi:hypothetical protein